MTVKELIARSKAAQAAFAFATQEQADAAAEPSARSYMTTLKKLGPWPQKNPVWAANRTRLQNAAISPH